MTQKQTTYATAGVDVEAGDRAVELMKSAVAATHNEHVFGQVGGFAGMFDVSFLKDYTRPLLATSTDGVGTKVAIAQALDIHHTIGYDLVGMVVDDIVVSGAKPLFMTDYIACGKVIPERIAGIVRGIAEACKEADVALVGGETAEHPGLLGPDEYDVAGAATGAIEADDLLGAHKVNAGDVIIGLPSSGIHSNGYSLVRRIIADAGWDLSRDVADFGRTLGEELLEPTKVYTGELLSLYERVPGAVHSVSHVTGGGLSANVARVLPAGTVAVMKRDTWDVPAVFNVLGDLGNVPRADRERTWNLGVGMVLVVDGARAAEVVAAYPGAWHLGEVISDTGEYRENPDYVQGAKGVDGGAAILID
ncbi:phosphoribosylformylglycinamidine cyclo-ligase [Brevibacterium sp. UMB10442]|uniref:phosphoribosylformylglycinamidine cyclo-ligase n=1 Tax=Brevibacterium sp. UMB1308A TaxID=3050608 RepID=UPI00254B6248|nr:phosphoribosylformylglycinamidine cyclo-ligase [Brevibacterium sp. UMB1308A]MDK7750728.1 phosphoribosylformylglycinamidine cyclo-ligase [Brevibacterium sp. UMB10442]MDK8346266.1 phosphoribosylformylglycinamidine cyclo-ligase [Brevibacterium sp. UMB1308B]MDK8712494.1 phosphoribosylformylglycinamidine cyclo-ligase [Brevibacterium sp. UMB1308A]